MTAVWPCGATASERRVGRVEIWPKAGQPDPLAESVLAEARSALGAVAAVRTARVYLIESAASDDELNRLAEELLSDPVTQESAVGAVVAAQGAVTVEVQYLPGVMDPVAQSTQDSIAEMLPHLAAAGIAVRTGVRYDFIFQGPVPHESNLRVFAERALANPVVQEIHLSPHQPTRFPQTAPYELKVRHVPLRDLDDQALMRLSRDNHLFLSLAEMKAIQAYYRGRGGEPTDVELETIAQTWSEHCVHKTFKSRIRYFEPGQASAESEPRLTAMELADRPGHSRNEDGSITIDNLLKSTVAAATHRLMQEEHFRQWCVSVFMDNAGVVKFDDQDAIAIKVETHNHPSAIEPYGGAATGIGGCIRDVMGTGLAAKPIANTDTFCVAPPDTAELPAGVIHPKRILQQVVAGVRDYGNRMGIPTVNGAVCFDPNYLGNPLVFAGCVGLIPLDKCFGQAQPGDRIIVLGGATGRDGIHGATFSSAGLTDTHAQEFAHAVQIGNAITQKKVLDVILQARDHGPRPLYHAITDCGAGGFSSAVGEMGRKIGARVTLETAPLKYAGLSYTEIWISEAQERMTLAVPPENVAALRALCEAEDVAMCDLGQFGCYAEGPGRGEPILLLTYKGTEVGRLSMDFLHEGLPQQTRQAEWAADGRPNAPRASRRSPKPPPRGPKPDLGQVLHALLAHPNIASKHWIIRQYDHEVQGGSAVKPLVGPMQLGPSDGAVLRPKLRSAQGIALACGLAPHLSEGSLQGRGGWGAGDSYWAALAAIDEAVRNLVCVGADPRRIAILDNFCWPSCDDPRQLGALVRAAVACYDGALAYRTPFISGKDSLNNQFAAEDGRIMAIPQTLLITGLGIVPDVARACTMDAKSSRGALLLVGLTDSRMGGSHHQMLYDDPAADPRLPHVDLKSGPRTAAAVANLIAHGLVAAAHDCSDGGLLVAAAEMAFAGDIGLDLDLANLPCESTLPEPAACFAETPSRYLLQILPDRLDAAVRMLRSAHVRFAQIGAFAEHKHLRVRAPRHGLLLDEPLAALRQSWRKTLDW